MVTVLWAVAAAFAWVRGHRFLAALFAMLAMWSKEEGFVVPAILTAWSFVDSHDARLPLGARVRRTLVETWTLWIAAAVSSGVRAWAGAWTPASAPSFYRYRFELSTLLENAYQYADRSATTPVLVVVLFWNEAGALVTEGRVRLWIEPPPADLAGGVPPDPTEVAAVLVVERGQVRRVQ